MCACIPHPPAIAVWAGCQLSDIETGMKDTTAHNDKEIQLDDGENCVWERKRQTEARNPDCITREEGGCRGDK